MNIQITHNIILEGGNGNVAKRYKYNNPFRQAAQLTNTGNAIRTNKTTVFLIKCREHNS